MVVGEVSTWKDQLALVKWQLTVGSAAADDQCHLVRPHLGATTIFVTAALDVWGRASWSLAW